MVPLAFTANPYLSCHSVKLGSSNVPEQTQHTLGFVVLGVVVLGFVVLGFGVLGLAALGLAAAFSPSALGAFGFLACCVVQQTLSDDSTCKSLNPHGWRARACRGSRSAGEC